MKIKQDYNKLSVSLNNIDLTKIKKVSSHIEESNDKISDISIALNKVTENSKVVKQLIYDYSFFTNNLNFICCFKYKAKIKQDYSLLKLQYSNLTMEIDSILSFSKNVDEILFLLRQHYICLNSLYKKYIYDHNYSISELDTINDNIKHNMAKMSTIHMYKDYESVISVVKEIIKLLFLYYDGISLSIKIVKMISHIEIAIQKDESWADNNIKLASKDPHSLKTLLDLQGKMLELLEKEKKCLNDNDLEAAFAFGVKSIFVLEKINEHISLTPLIKDRTNDIKKIIKKTLLTADKISQNFNSEINDLHSFFCGDVDCEIAIADIKCLIENIKSEYKKINQLASKKSSDIVSNWSDISNLISDISINKQKIQRKSFIVLSKLKDTNYMINQTNNIELTLNHMSVLLKKLKQNSRTNSLSVSDSFIDSEIKKVKALRDNILSNSINHSTIKDEISNMTKQLMAIAESLYEAYMLSVYCEKMLMYCNRFINDDSTELFMSNNLQLYKSGKYVEAIEAMIDFLK